MRGLADDERRRLVVDRDFLPAHRQRALDG